MIPELALPLAAVCHDAGAANHVIAWLRSAAAIDHVRALMCGPAARLWEEAFPRQPVVESMHAALKGTRLLVSGSGWGSDVEHEARIAAAAMGIRSVAVLDHWVNYEQRFVRAGKQVMPDEFWVVDEHAERLARAAFPGRPVRRMPNLYLANLLLEIGPPPQTGAECLYLLEPSRSSWDGDSPGEFQALDYFVSRVRLLGMPPGTVIRLRPHPSDPRGKYDLWLQRHAEMPFLLDAEGSLSSAISRAAWVVGCETFALTIALAAGRRVYCSLPPWAPPCRLPQEGLVHLNQFVEVP